MTLRELITNYNDELSKMKKKHAANLLKIDDKSDYTQSYYERETQKAILPVFSKYKSEARNLSSYATSKINSTKKSIETVLFPKSYSLDPSLKAEGMSEVQLAMTLTSGTSKASKLKNAILDAKSNNQKDLANSIIKFVLYSFDEFEIQSNEFAKEINQLKQDFASENGLFTLEAILKENELLKVETERFIKAIDEKIYPYFSDEILHSFSQEEFKDNLEFVNKSLAIQV